VNQDMKGTSITWYEICNVDGHPLVLPGGVNSFQSEQLAATAAAATCVDYRDTVTVKEHVTTIKRVFRADIKAVEA
jgi:hypothetical protein